VTTVRFDCGLRWLIGHFADPFDDRLTSTVVSVGVTLSLMAFEC
jgi:hypothetical protein